MHYEKGFCGDHMQAFEGKGGGYLYASTSYDKAWKQEMLYTIGCHCKEAWNTLGAFGIHRYQIVCVSICWSLHSTKTVVH